MTNTYHFAPKQLFSKVSIKKCQIFIFWPIIRWKVPEGHTELLLENFIDSVLRSLLLPVPVVTHYFFSSSSHVLPLTGVHYYFLFLCFIVNPYIIDCVWMTNSITMTKQQQRINSLAFFVALWSISKTTVSGLHVTNNYNNNNNNNNNKERDIFYYTSVAETKCAHPRPVSSVQTGYQRNPIAGIDVDVDYPITTGTKNNNNAVPFQRQDLAPFTVFAPPTDQKETKDPPAFAEKNMEVKTPKPSKASALPTSVLPSRSSTPPPQKKLVNLGCLLAINSGFLNGLGLSGVLGKAASVSAVTGTYTNAAVVFSQQLSLSALALVLATPLCYMLGSMVNGLLNYEGLADMGHLNFVQTAPLLLSGSLVFLANVVSKWHVLPTLALLTFAMGLQNSWTSMILKGNLLRTAHFSGITSDLGTVLGQTLRGNKENAFKLSIFAKLAACFWMGGMSSVLGVRYWGIPASACLTASSLLYLNLWASWTTPLRQKVSAAIVQSRRRSWIHQHLRQRRRRRRQQQQQQQQPRAAALGHAS